MDQIVAVDQIGTASAKQDLLLYEVASVPGAGLTGVLTSLAGEVHGAMAAAAPAAGRWTRDTVVRQLGFGSSDGGRVVGTGTGLWADINYDQGTWKADSVASKFDTSRNQFVVGLDGTLLTAGRIGLALTHSQTDVNARAGKGALKETMLLAYGQGHAGGATIDALVGYGATDWNTTRTDPLSADGALAGSANGNSVLADLGVHRAFDAGRVVLEPYARFTYQMVSRDRFDEQGTSLAALSAGAYTSVGQEWSAGLTLRSAVGNPLAAPWTYRLRAGLAYDHGDLLNPTLNMTLAGAALTVRSPDVGRSGFQAEALVTMRMSERMYAYLGASGEARSNHNAVDGVLGVRYAF